MKFDAEYFETWKITTWSISNRFEVELTITKRLNKQDCFALVNIGSVITFIDSFLSNILILSQNGNKSLSIFFSNSSSWFWDFKTSLPAAKKRIRKTILSDIFRGAVSRGTSPLDSPNSVLYEPDHLDKKLSKLFYSNKNKNKRGHDFKIF